MSDFILKRKQTGKIILFEVYSLVLFISIIKFGAPAAIADLCYFPSNIFEWIIFTWPTELFSVASIIFFLISIILFLFYSEECELLSNSITKLYGTLWFALALTSLLGYIHSTNIDYATLEIFYVFGLSLFALTIILIRDFDKNLFERYTIKSIIFASAIIIIYGIYQYFSGFESTRTALAGQGFVPQLINSNFNTRLMQNYVYSIFSLTNSYGGFLVGVLPLLLYSALNSKKKIIGRVTVTAFCFLALISIYLTGSRSSILAFLVAVLLLILISQIKIIYKFCLISTSILLSCLGFITLIAKGSSSVLVRFDYWKVSLSLFLKNIFYGSGWGSFFLNYCKYKTYDSTETSLTPHNFFFLFLSQAGLIAGITIAIIIVFPMFIIALKYLKNKKLDPRLGFLFCSVLGLSIHMSLDIDFQVPSLMIIMICISVIISGKLNLSESLFIEKSFDILFNIGLISSLLVTLFFSIYIIPFRAELSKFIKKYYYNSVVLSGSSLTPNNDKSIKIDLNILSKIQPQSPTPWSLAGHYFCSRKEWSEAARCYKSAVDNSPHQASYYYMLGICKLYQGSRDQAYKNFEKASLLFPKLYQKKYNDFKNRYGES